MKLLALLTLLLCKLSAAHASDKQKPALIDEEGTTTISASADKLNVKVSIDTRRIGGGDSRGPICTRSRSPCSVIEGLGITVNGRVLFIPPSSFCDLSDLRDGQITISGDKAILQLGGGDASEGYRVKITFDASRVRARTFFSSLAPDEPLQETTYYQVALD